MATTPRDRYVPKSVNPMRHDHRPAIVKKPGWEEFSVRFQ